MWTLGDASGAETCVAVAVVAAVAVAVVAVTPTASASSGGRSSSSLRLLKAHEALLITIINRLWEEREGREEQTARVGRGGSPQTDVYQRCRLQDPTH